MIIKLIILLSLSYISISQCSEKYLNYQTISNGLLVTGINQSPDRKFILLTYGYYNYKRVVLLKNNGTFYDYLSNFTLPLSYDSDNKNFSTKYSQSSFSADSKFLILGGSQLNIYNLLTISYSLGNPFFTYKINGSYFLNRQITENGKNLVIWAVDSNKTYYHIVLTSNDSFTTYTQYISPQYQAEFPSFIISPNGNYFIGYTQDPSSTNAKLWIGHELNANQPIGNFTLNQQFNISGGSFISYYKVDLTNQYIVVASKRFIRIIGISQQNPANNIKIIYPNVTQYLSFDVVKVKITKDNNRIYVLLTNGDIVILYQSSSQNFQYETTLSINSQQIKDIALSDNGDYLITNNRIQLIIFINCSLCIKLWYIKGNKCQQKCEYGYIDGRYCRPCENGCLQCTSSTECLSCSLPLYLRKMNDWKTGFCSQCPIKQMVQTIYGYNYSNQYCIICAEQCKTCLYYPQNCLQCGQGYIRYANQQSYKCVKNDIYVFYVVISGILLGLFILGCGTYDKGKNIFFCPKYEQLDHEEDNDPSLQNIQQKAIYEECAICLLFQLSHITKCGHRFHQKCISHWINLHNNCPTCRQKLSIDDIQKISQYTRKK